jgi:hypothetical protein
MAGLFGTVPIRLALLQRALQVLQGQRPLHRRFSMRGTEGWSMVLRVRFRGRMFAFAFDQGEDGC